MIVVHHSVGLFGIDGIGMNLGQGVSFFFVLSGFILAYVYPELGTWAAVRRFWRARIARIWPAYLASFALGFVLLHYPLDGRTAAAHLLMVQAWLPLSAYYFSYNAPAWSVSTEMFFYLAFPVLVWKWRENWWKKLALAALVLVGLIVLSNRLALPDYGNPHAGAEGLLITQHGLLYINPISRIFEFIFGMCTALAWRARGVRWAPIPATVYELLAVALCGVSMATMGVLAAAATSGFDAAAGLWVTHSGSVFAFGLLVYVMAHGRGLLSRLLRHPFLVRLGEISFSLYLIHQILLIRYRDGAAELPKVPDLVAFGAFMVVLSLASYAIWTLIEMPGRRLLMGQGAAARTAVASGSWGSRLVSSRLAALACVVPLLAFVALAPATERSAETARAIVQRPDAPALTPEAADSCRVDVLNGRAIAPQQEPEPVTQGRTVSLVGWAVDAVSRTAPSEVYIGLDGVQSYTIRVSRRTRQDVADHFEEPGFRRAGWAVRGDLSAVAPGVYAVKVIQIADGRRIECATALSLVLR